VADDVYQLKTLKIPVRAARWFRNGDHPDDRVGEVVPAPYGGGESYTRLEGAVVRFFRSPRPERAGNVTHEACGRTFHDHGWIDTLDGLTVCPGMWVITHPLGWYEVCTDEVFRQMCEELERYCTASGRPVRVEGDRCRAHGDAAVMCTTSLRPAECVHPHLSPNHPTPTCEECGRVVVL